MLPKQHRVTTRLFEEIHKAGKREHSPHFVLSTLIRQHTEAGKVPPARFGISVPKKVAALAVDRNRLKRQISAVLEKNYQHFPTGMLGVIVAKSGAGSLTPEALSTELVGLFSRFIR